MTVTFEQKQTAERIVQETVVKLSCFIPIHVEWKALKSRIGDAHYATGRIRFSTLFWPSMTESQRRNTVIHEVCHLVAHKLYGPFIKPHGREWKALMLDCGEVGKSFKRVTPTEATKTKRHVKKFVTVCGCGEHPITQNRWTRMQRGSRYRCRTCGESLRAA